MSHTEHARAQPQGRGREKPGKGGEGKFYRIVVRPKEEFVTFRTQDVGNKGHIERLAGKRENGSWDTQVWLCSTPFGITVVITSPWKTPKAGPVDGFAHFGPAQGDPEWHVYREIGSPRDHQAGDTTASATAHPVLGIDWDAQAARFVATFRPDQRMRLADSLRLHPEEFIGFPNIGYCFGEQRWTLPECGADG